MICEVVYFTCQFTFWPWLDDKMLVATFQTTTYHKHNVPLKMSIMNLWSNNTTWLLSTQMYSFVNKRWWDDALQLQTLKRQNDAIFFYLFWYNFETIWSTKHQTINLYKQFGQVVWYILTITSCSYLCKYFGANWPKVQAIW